VTKAGDKDGGMTLERVHPPFEADERTTLTAFLDFQRATLAFKCDGLTEEQLREQAKRRRVLRTASTTVSSDHLTACDLRGDLRH